MTRGFMWLFSYDSQSSVMPKVNCISKKSPKVKTNMLGWHNRAGEALSLISVCKSRGGVTVGGSGPVLGVDHQGAASHTNLSYSCSS